MGIESPDAHNKRSAALQRLLDEADGKPSRADGTASSRTPPSNGRSERRPAPPTGFPRRSTRATRISPATTNAEGQRRAEPMGDPAARLRRSALVRSPIAGSRQRPRVERTAATVPPSTKTAAARSLAGRWGAAGFSPVLPERRPEVERVLPPRAAQPPRDALPPRTALPPRDAQPSMPSVVTAEGPTMTGNRSSTVLAPDGRPRQRRTLVLAGGVAAAVVAIVAVVSLGNRSGSGPGANAAPTPERVVMVETTGVNSQPTLTTVTAQVSTVNGVVVALVPDADGQVRQLPVVTATPPAAATRSVSPTPTAPSSGGRPAGAPAVPTSVASSSTAATASPTSTPATTAPATTAPANPAPANPDDDVATVVTGLTTLTGWVPVTTG